MICEFQDLTYLNGSPLFNALSGAKDKLRWRVALVEVKNSEEVEEKNMEPELREIGNYVL